MAHKILKYFRKPEYGTRKVALCTLCLGCDKQPPHLLLLLREQSPRGASSHDQAGRGLCCGAEGVVSLQRGSRMRAHLGLGPGCGPNAVESAVAEAGLWAQRVALSKRVGIRSSGRLHGLLRARAL